MAMIKQWLLTWRTRKCRGNLTLRQYHIFRLYKIHVAPYFSTADTFDDWLPELERFAEADHTCNEDDLYSIEKCLACIASGAINNAGAELYDGVKRIRAEVTPTA